MTLHAYGEYQAAAKAYERARAIDPRSFDWAYLLGAAQFASGDFESASASFEAALLLNAQNVPARLRLAQTLSAMAKWDAAIADYRTILRDRPDTPQAWYGLGRVQAAKGDRTAAIDSYAKACDLFPQYGPAHFALATELKKSDRNAEAERHLTAYKTNPTAEPPLDDPLFRRINQLNNSAQAHLQRGAELERSGNLPEAIREHEAALAVDPENVQAHTNLISLYARANQPEKAYAAAFVLLSLVLILNFAVDIAVRRGRKMAWGS